MSAFEASAPEQLAGDPPGARPRLRRFFSAAWIDREKALADLRLPEVGRGLQRVHLAVGLFWCFMLGWPVSMMELAAIPLGIVVAYRVFCTPAWRGYRWVFFMPAFVLLLAWTLWQVMTLLWSTDVKLGVEQFGAMRFGWTIWALLPLMHERRKLIVALVLGFLAFNLSQLANHVGVRFGVGWLAIRPFTDRNGGWWPEVFAGEMLAAALGLHLPAAMMGRGRTRVLALAGCILTLLGIFATGTRAGWLAAAGLIAIVAIVAVCRLPTPRERWRAAGIVGALVVVAGATVWFTVGPSVVRRFEAAYTEVQRAVQSGDYNSDNGVRLKMKDWAIQAFREHPMTGIGVGSFREWVREHADDAGGAKERFLGARHGHAHNAILHTMAATGLIGLVILLGAWTCALGAGFTALSREQFGTYAAGPVFAIVGLLLITPFDAIHVNAQSSAVLLTLIALCPPFLPKAH